jgi:hypothetical protein
VDDDTEIDVSVFGGGTVLLDPPEHPVLAIISEREKRQARMESNQGRRMGTCMNPPNINFPKKSQ